RMEFPGRDLVFNFMLATLMIPAALTLIPAYVLMTKLRLINTFWALIIPGAVSAGSIFMLTQFFKAIPKDLEEAAVIDGAKHSEIYREVILPLTRPALLTVFILQFQAMWNNFLQPLLYLNTPDKYVLNVALSIFQQQFKAQWNLTLVGAMFNAIPVMILFFIFSKYFVEGVAYTGIKG
ncbi:MAG: carbohydrate ABC transporter permease, partial [Byssovorax cruenta]